MSLNSESDITPQASTDISPEEARSERRVGNFSWRRVALSVLAVFFTLAPVMLLLELAGVTPEGIGLSRQQNAALAQGSGTRGAPAFDLSSAIIPRNEILGGGPPKDGIPALTNPKFIPEREASYLNRDDRVIGIVRGQDARAYPLAILNYHEIVNDSVGDLPVAVTYCPLCDSAAVFDRRTPLGHRDFGVSGLLYNSNVLMYDRGGEPESLWSQIKTTGISGPGANHALKTLPVELTTWDDWRTRHPETKVLSPQTGHQRDYRRNPYAGYFDQPGLMFSARPTSDRLPTKARVLGVWTDANARAYPLSAFGNEPRTIEDLVDGKKVVIHYDPRARSLRVVEAEEGFQWMYSLWFSWYAMRPETDVFQGPIAEPHQ